MQKVLSVIIPVYNMEKYIRQCLESLMIREILDKIEILVVLDGSTDRSEEIAMEYVAAHPDSVRVISKPNGGHGSAINTGMDHAAGEYVKVLDSDDWVNEEAYKQILKTLEELTRGPKTLDMLISNFVYEKQGASRKKVMQYRHCFPTNQIFGWDEIRHMKNGQYLLMLSMIYRTKLLHDCGMELPKHTFYVDNLFAFEPLPYVKNLYYLDVNFYRYFIGRDDQSVNETNMIKRIDQQFKVTYIMIDYMTQFNLVSKPLERYMRHYLSIIMCISSVISVKSGQKELLKMRKELWKYLYDSDKRLYRKIRHNITSCAVNLPGYVGRKATIAMYKAARRFIGFN